MGKPTDKIPALALLDKLEAKYAIREEFFEVQLPDGEILKFRTVRTLTQKKELKRAIFDFGERISTAKSIPAEWKKYLPIDRDVAESLAVIKLLSVEPKFTDLDILRLHAIPHIADFIAYQMMDKIRLSTDFADIEDIDEAKKDSAPTN